MTPTLRRTCLAVAAAAAATLTIAPALGAAADTDAAHRLHADTSSVRDVAATAMPVAPADATEVPVTSWRIAGEDRFGTAVAASRTSWDDAGAAEEHLAEAVVLSRSDAYADALGGAALAGAATGPLLLTSPVGLRADVRAEIDRVLGGTGVVYLLGGTGALSPGIEEGLVAAGYDVVRLAGLDRYATSVAVAQEVGRLAPGERPQFVFATTGLNFPDGLAAGATAGGYWAAVVLTRDGQVPPSVLAYLESQRAAGVGVYAVGGAAAGTAALAWDASWVGADRYETAAMLADDFWREPETGDGVATGVGLATGLNWPDALAGGAFMAGRGPLMLTRTGELPRPTAAVTAALRVTEPTPLQGGYVFGGESVVAPTPAGQFAHIVAYGY